MLYKEVSALCSVLIYTAFIILLKSAFEITLHSEVSRKTNAH